MFHRRSRSGFSPTRCIHVGLKPDLRGSPATTLLAMLVAACAAPDTLVVDEPRSATEFAIAPYEFHEECATLLAGDRIDYRFGAKAPVTFQIYYKEGITFISTVSHEDVQESAGMFNVPAARRYCARWDAGQQGALVDFRIRVLRANK